MVILNSLRDILFMAFMVLLQVVIFNNINFLGYANPYFYIFFLIVFPITRNKYLYLFYALILGLGVDFFENTGGVNAFACVFIAFIRYYLMKLFFSGSPQDDEDHSLADLNIAQWLIYLVVMIIVHHLLVDMLDSFKLNTFLSLLQKTAISALITLVLTVIVLMLFPIYRKKDF